MIFYPLRSVQLPTLFLMALFVMEPSTAGRTSAGETVPPESTNSRADKMSAANLLQQFAQDWPDDRTAYRIEGDTSWIAYALTLKRLVAQGDAAVPALLTGCNDPQIQVRALSARVLGFLSGGATGVKKAKTQSVVTKLIGLLDDSSPLVALMAADALGQIQDPRGLEALRAARQHIEHGDVLLHIAKGLQRQVPLEEDVHEQILRIGQQQINSATVGQPAPDFTLRDPSGQAWKMADFRGKKSVVLVFIYGDG